MRKLLTFLFPFLFCFALHAEFINIGVFASKKVNSFTFSVRAGKYALFTEAGKIKELESKASLNIKYVDGFVEVKQDGKSIGKFRKVNLMGVGWYNHFMVKSTNPEGLERRFDDNLKIVAQRNKMQLINNLDLDNYVAGVVEAEVGRKPPKEYFKLQAIICRTYALANTEKHIVEGYNLCDEVHCQAYHGKTFFNNIVEASMQTRGAVIVDSEIQLITAAFHSSCGGQTVNSEDVWSKSLYYLRSVKDTFCLKHKDANWQKEIDKNQWKNYLTARLPNTIKEQQYMNLSLNERMKYFPQSKLSFEELRGKFRLRSTYFNIQETANNVLLKGRGFGHGVGLCQIGAMEMAALGYNYSEILHFYYSGVHIIDLSALDFFKED
jgi:stage II sporulation protein D